MLMDDTCKAKKSHWERSEESPTPRSVLTKNSTVHSKWRLTGGQSRREPSEQYEQNARNSDSGLETQLSNWQVFNIWGVRLQQMGSQRVNEKSNQKKAVFLKRGDITVLYRGKHNYASETRGTI